MTFIKNLLAYIVLIPFALAIMMFSFAIDCFASVTYTGSLDTSITFNSTGGGVIIYDYDTPGYSLAGANTPFGAISATQFFTSYFWDYKGTGYDLHFTHGRVFDSSPGSGTSACDALSMSSCQVIYPNYLDLWYVGGIYSLTNPTPTPTPTPTPSPAPANEVITNNYIFLIGTMGIFFLQLITILIILYLCVLIIGWPIKKFIRAIMRIINQR